MVDEDPEGIEKRKQRRNPYKSPDGNSDESPTGVIVRSKTDKIAVGPPCLIWIPLELMELVQAHSLLASKFLPRTVDLYHPNTRLFLNSNGKPIAIIECKHFKTYIGLPITAYDFRRSLATYCLEHKDQAIKTAEASVLRHNEYTGFAYYYTKHSENVELVNVQYAVDHNLIRADKDAVDKYAEQLRQKSGDKEWELIQRRTDKALEVKREAFVKRKKAKDAAKKKSTRHFILPEEFDAFMAGFDEAVKEEKVSVVIEGKSSPFSQLLKYLPDNKDGGFFPPNKVWYRDFCRILFGLEGPVGEKMREADLSVYDGVPFSSLSGRNKLKDAKNKRKSTSFQPYQIVAAYWREKIRDETRASRKSHWKQIRFAFTKEDFEYYEKMRRNDT